MEAFILILMIAGAGIAVAAVKSGGSNADAVWRAAAQRLGLRFAHTDMSSSPIISGARRGFSVRIDTYAKSGDNSRMYTRYRVSFERSLGLGLSLTRQRPISHVAKKLGTQDILTGDEDFDAAVVVMGRDPQKIIEFLTPARKRRAVRFLTLAPGSTIDDVKVESETRDVERSPDLLVQMIQRMTSMAEHLTADADAGPDYLAAMAHSVETETDRHFRGLPYHPAPGHIALEDLLEVESEPAEVTESPRSFFEAPEASDEEILSEAEPPELDELLPEAAEEEEEEEAEPSSSDEVGPSIGTLVEALFTLGQTISRTAEVFESHYKDRSVEWSGTLTNVRSYRFDLVFGDVPGTRVEIEVVGAAGSAAGGRAVKAVVQCPVEAEDKLRAQVDHHVVFRGVLISCDAFMKTLFLTDGEIGEGDA